MSGIKSYGCAADKRVLALESVWCEPALCDGSMFLGFGAVTTNSQLRFVESVKKNIVV